MDRILNMVARRVVSRLVNKGVDIGVDQIVRRNGQAADGAAPTPEQEARVRNTTKNARQAMKLARRVGRF